MAISQANPQGQGAPKYAYIPYYKPYLLAIFSGRFHPIDKRQ